MHVAVGDFTRAQHSRRGSPKESILLAKAHQNTIQLMPILLRNVCTPRATEGEGMGVMVASMHLATATSTPAELLHPPARSVLHGSVHHLPSAPWPTHTLSLKDERG